MENPVIEESYEVAKRKARELYSKIGRVWCPALKDYVAFNSVGFRHLIWKGGKRRSPEKQMERFSLIPYAAPMVASLNPKITFRKKRRRVAVKWRGAKTRAISEARFWALSGKAGDEHIRLIIRQIGAGKKHFLSIFQYGKQKPPLERVGP